MLDATLWIAQIFLALFFLAAGLPKVLGRGIDRWVGFDRVPRPLTVLIGVSEAAAAVGLVVPMLVDEVQWATPLAAMGLAAVCAMAAGFHLREQEWLPALETVLWSSLAIVVVIGRWDELSTGPSISTDVLVPVIGLLVAAIVVNLAILFRQPLPTATADSVAS
jgi:uncharacterized membrane protein YphA (DoxX/SURF4 family)